MLNTVLLIMLSDMDEYQQPVLIIQALQRLRHEWMSLEDPGRMSYSHA